MLGLVKGFWLPGLLAILTVGATINFGLTSRMPYLDNLLAKPGPPGYIAASVMVVTVWTLIALAVRALRARGESAVIRRARTVVAGIGRPFGVLGLDSQLQRLGAAYETSMLRRRFDLLRDRLGDHNRSERAEALMGGQSGIDAAHTVSSYGPLRALVWALPALGFMGTAFEMARAVGGLGAALAQTQGYNELRNVLVNQVVPHLAGAFDITLLALGCSVLCYFLISLAYRFEEGILIEADAVSVQLLAKLQDQPASGGDLALLQPDMRSLAEHLRRINDTLTLFNEGDHSGSLVPVLGNMASLFAALRVDVAAMRESLEQEYVVTRRPRAEADLDRREGFRR